jgi:glycosyltransferase involved in cell wall biosynthesis
MKLLQILPTTGRGGCEEYAILVAKEAISRGHQVSVVLPELPATKSIFNDYHSMNVQSYPSNIGPPSRFPHDKLPAIRRAFRIRTVLKAVRPDVVQFVVPSTFYAFGAMLGCASLKVPSVAIFGLAVPSRTVSGRTKKAYDWIQRRSCKFVAVSQHNRKILANSFDLAEKQILHIPNGATLSTPAGNRETVRAEVRTEFGLPSNALLLFGVGRLDRQKGYDLLIPCLPHLKAEFPNLHLAIAGEGDERQSLEAQARKYGVQDRLHLLGRRKDISRLLLSADLFVFPSRFEGYPLSLIEAIGMDLPVVAADSTSIPELITHRKEGFLVRMEDPCDLMEGIRWALRHPVEMREMALNARKRAEQFSAMRMMDETFALFEQVAQS